MVLWTQKIAPKQFVLYNELFRINIITRQKKLCEKPDVGLFCFLDRKFGVGTSIPNGIRPRRLLASCNVNSQHRHNNSGPALYSVLNRNLACLSTFTLWSSPPWFPSHATWIGAQQKTKRFSDDVELLEN